MANVLLGVTGSVAAIHTRELYEALRDDGHHVKVVATTPALYFFDPADIAALTDGGRDPAVVILDEDEWPGDRYRRGDTVLHIELRRWADVLLIAPLDANTLGKLALGVCDNCLTCVYRAWDRSRRVMLAPAMNTLMWHHPATARHLAQIAEDMTGEQPPSRADVDTIRLWLDERRAPLTIVPPVVKELACQDVGIGAMASRGEIQASLRPRS